MKIFYLYVISVLVAVPFTWALPLYLYKKIEYLKLTEDKYAGRVGWIPCLVGIFERIIITTLIGFNISGAASFIGTWVAIKTAGGWATWSTGSTYGRAVLFVSLLGNALSIIFALVCGIVIYNMRGN